MLATRLFFWWTSAPSGPALVRLVSVRGAVPALTAVTGSVARLDGVSGAQARLTTVVGEA